MRERSTIDISRPRDRFGFGIMFAGAFVAMTYLANLDYHEDLEVHSALAAETRDVGRAMPADVPQGQPVLLTLDLSGETRVCDRDLGWCLDTVIYARDVETRVRTRSTVVERRNGVEREYVDQDIFWTDDAYNQGVNPEPFPGIEPARAISDGIRTQPAYRLSEAAVVALLERPGAVLSDTEITPSDVNLGYAGDGWWRPNAPDGPDLGEQRMRVRTVPAGTYTLLASVSDGIIQPAAADGRDVLIARAGAADLSDIIEAETPSAWELAGKAAFLSGFMAIGLIFAVSAFTQRRSAVLSISLLLTLSINAAIYLAVL